MINIGIVGCGRILNAHLQGYKQLRELGIDNFRITALCARRESDALMFRKRGEGPTPRPPVIDPATGDPLAAPHTYLSDFQDDVDVQVFTDYNQMIASGCVNAINDFTTLSLHHQVGRATLEAGYHLLAQKPLAISVRAGKLLVDLAHERKLTLGVFENVRQMTIVRAMAWAVQRGLIGTPQVAVMGGLGGVWSPDRAVADTPWRHNKLQAGGGGSIDIGVHQVHWMRYVVGEIASVGALARTLEPVRYRRDDAGTIIEQFPANVDDTYFASLVFDRGTIGQLWWSWAMHERSIDLPDVPAIMGTEGNIRGNLLERGNQTLQLTDYFEESLSPEEREKFYPLGLRDPYAIQQLDWLRAIQTGNDPETSGEEGLRDLACAFAIAESSLLGRQVAVDEVLSGAVDTYQREIDEYYRLIGTP